MVARLRLYLGIWAAKLSFLVLRALGRNGSQVPGLVALKVCPSWLTDVTTPKRVIVVTGTNGKTTVANLLIDALAGEGIPTTNNRAGSNTDAGVVSALAVAMTWSGRPTTEVAVLEMDERSALRILPGLRPEILVCTNLTRDSIKRNAHPEYIAWILSSGISEDTTLVLNADDLICAGVGSATQGRRLFGVEQLPSDTTEPRGVALDLTVCPMCGTTLVWDFWRFNHIGHAHCPACGFASTPPEYAVTSVDYSHERITMNLRGRDLTCHLLNDNIVNIYNQIAVCTTLDLVGIPLDRIGEAFDHLAAPATRYSAQQVGQVTLVRQLTKGLVGVACSRAFHYIMAAPGTKALVMNIDEVTDAKDDCENTCWIYDADYEFLADPSLKQVVVGGGRRYDQALRLAIAGVDPQIIETTPDERGAAEMINLDGIERVYNLHSVHNAISTGNHVQTRLLARLGGGVE